MTPPAEYRNIHGRQWGRGLRPYLLLPKIICVGIFLGGVVSILVLVFLQPPPTTTAAWRDQADLLRLAYRRIIIPALLGAMILGLLLFLPHAGAFIRMRWLQLKLVIIAACVPPLHLFMYTRSVALWAVLWREPADLTAAALLRRQMLFGTLAVLAFALVIVFLGRIKPRLGQDYARTFTRPNADLPISPDR